MKQIFTLLFAVAFLSAQSFAQCTITGFDVCTGASPVTSFTNAQLVSGNDLANGSKYKFNNVTSGIGALDAIVTIDGNSNATLLSFDDDNAADETGVAGTQAALFSPKISASSDLKNAAQSGYVQFTVTFYLHYPGNTLPPVGVAPVPVTNLNFLHFDMDGHTIGNNGYFREMGCVKMPSLTLTDLLNYGAVGTELSSGGMINDLGDNWRLTYGSTKERDGVSRCAEVMEKSVYALPQSSVSFRMGYDYKPAFPYAGQSQGKPVRQYGSKFGCFSIPSAAPLPVTLTAFSVNYNNSVANVNWATEQEINLANYEVLRSVNGTDFQTISTVTSRNSLSRQNYTYQDNNIPSGASVLYYKLRIVDKDASFKYSNVVTVKVSAARAKDFLITPNPASTNAQIRFNADKAGQAQVIIFDAAGKAVMQQQANVLTGNNNIAINNIVKLSEGMYTVKMIVNNESFSSKLIVWK
jgi:hypothetical protein